MCINAIFIKILIEIQIVHGFFSYIQKNLDNKNISLKSVLTNN